MLLLSMKNLKVLKINEADYETKKSSVFENTVPLANVPAETASDLTWGIINSS